MELRETKPKGGYRYLPPGNHAGCVLIHISEHRRILRRTLFAVGLRHAAGSYWPQGVSQGSAALRIHRHEMRRLFSDQRSGDFLNCNLLIAYYCGFDITKPLPSYWTFDRFIRKLDHRVLQEIMGKQVQKLYELGILDASFIGLDSTPVAASTAQNNPKSFLKNKFSKDNQPKNDPDCALGVHTASNQHNEKNFEF